MIQNADSVAPRPSATNGYPASSPKDDRSLRDVCVDLRDKVDAFLAEKPATPLLGKVQEQVRISSRVIQEAFRRYTPEQISISYNGGKDCLVLTLLVLSCLPRHFLPESDSLVPPPTSSSSSPSPSAGHHAPSTKSSPNGTGPAATPGAPTPSAGPPRPGPFPESLQAVYIVPPHPFPEVDRFVASSGREFHLQLAKYNLPMRAALESYRLENPQIEAVFVGTRRTDPHAENLKHFDPTDSGWPTFMRVHPVIDWHYAEIWAFIRHLGVPYCPLYDQGYTSLGGKQNTHPNPQLKKEGDDGFRPAYELMDDDEERLGRDA